MGLIAGILTLGFCPLNGIHTCIFVTMLTFHNASLHHLLVTEQMYTLTYTQILNYKAVLGYKMIWDVPTLLFFWPQQHNQHNQYIKLRSSQKTHRPLRVCLLTPSSLWNSLRCAAFLDVWICMDNTSRLFWASSPFLGSITAQYSSCRFPFRSWF